MKKACLGVLSLGILSACSNSPECDSSITEKTIFESLKKNIIFESAIIYNSSQYKNYKAQIDREELIKEIKPTVLASYNPDAIKDEYEKAIQSCWDLRNNISSASLKKYIEEQYPGNLLFQKGMREDRMQCLTEDGRKKVKNDVEMGKKKAIEKRDRGDYDWRSALKEDHCKNLYEDIDKDLRFNGACDGKPWMDIDSLSGNPYSISERNLTRIGLREFSDYENQILIPLYEKYKEQLEGYNASIEEMLSVKVQEMNQRWEKIRENAPPVDYSISEIITTRRNESTGAVHCTARIEGVIPGWGSASQKIAYDVQVDSENNTHVKFYNLF